MNRFAVDEDDQFTVYEYGKIHFTAVTAISKFSLNINVSHVEMNMAKFTLPLSQAVNISSSQIRTRYP